MQNARLPLELCELIIDSSVEPSRPWWDGRDPSPADVSHLRSYTSICTAWLKRARSTLYHTVVLTSTSQIDLFVRSTTENPLLADLVRGIVVLSRGSYPNSGTYIPLAREALVRSFRHLSTLVFSFEGQARWSYPPRYEMLLANFPITELVLLYADATSNCRTLWFETFRLVWSLRHLQTLHLDMGRSSSGLTDSDVQRLKAMQRPWACAELKTLILGGDCWAFLPEGAFGKSVTRLSLKVTELRFTATLMAQIRPFACLQDICVSMHDSLFTFSAGENHEHKRPRRERHPLGDPTGPAVPVVIIPPSRFRKTFPNREAFLESCASSGLSEFSELKTLRLDIAEPYGSRYDADWWRRQLYEYVPEFRDIVRIAVRVYWPDRDDWE
ncbi:hypothetical protein L226DRAFT_569108 [Lentinus tigrinus ALCF2SS1-7]|uniref:uncharacterized protein n=1 Tax=Lentinus tigrinus ALCF2SS1-7 TaxID=1328758 RepID=UPI001165F915|nr:hypothetical protein L226DRAFT_569108 [Lentinus tigrinus ALCF2SS1-7]